MSFRVGYMNKLYNFKMTNAYFYYTLLNYLKNIGSIENKKNWSKIKEHRIFNIKSKLEFLFWAKTFVCFGMNTIFFIITSTNSLWFDVTFYHFNNTISPNTRFIIEAGTYIGTLSCELLFTRIFRLEVLIKSSLISLIFQKINLSYREKQRKNEIYFC